MTEIELRQDADLDARWRYSEALANATNLPKEYRRNPANVLWAVEFGRSVGLEPITAITKVHMIEGKPSASAGLMTALVRRAGHRLRVWIERDGQGQPTAIATITRHDDPDFTFRCEWSMARARQAGVTKNPTWSKYPEAMLKARATSEVAREACEEALSGVSYTPEELGATVDRDGNPIQDVTHQARVSDHRPTSIAEAAAQSGGVEVAEVPEPDADTGPGITEQQLKQLAGLMRFRGMGSDDGKRFCSETVGRPVQSSRSLSADEADQVIAALSDPAAEEPVDAEVVEEPAQLPVEDPPADPWAERPTPA